MSQLFATLVAGLAQAMPLFLAASGLTLIFGVMHVLNFAHGAFFMIGAYMLTTLLGGGSVPFGLMLGAALLAAIVAGAVGGVSEVLAIRRLYDREHFITLLATFALLLVIQGAIQKIWGVQPRSQQLSPALTGAVEILGARLPRYDLFLIASGGLVAVGLYLLLNRTRFGRTLRAVAEDYTMARAVGVSARRLQIAVFAIGTALAGLAGALSAPLMRIDLSLAHAFVLQSFAVVIVGGLGSLTGALTGALLIGMAESALVSYAPGFAGFSLYFAVALALLFRPQGLFGRRTNILGAA